MLKVKAELKVTAFKTDVKNCRAFSIENQGNSYVFFGMLDDGAEVIFLPPGGAREFRGFECEEFDQVLTARFDANPEISTDPNDANYEQRVDKVLVIKTLVKPNRDKE